MEMLVSPSGGSVPLGPPGSAVTGLGARAGHSEAAQSSTDPSSPALPPPLPHEGCDASAGKGVPAAERQREALFRKLNWHRWALPSLGLCPGGPLLGQGLAASVTLARVSLAWPRLTLVGDSLGHKPPTSGPVSPSEEL